MYVRVQVPLIDLGSVYNTQTNDTSLMGTVASGTILGVVCNMGYEISSRSSSVACDNGTWNSLPRCLPGKGCTQMIDEVVRMSAANSYWGGRHEANLKRNF